MSTVLFLISILLSGSSVFAGQLDVTTIPPPGTCQPITAVTMCINVDWVNASFPNLREHQNQQEANEEAKVFQPLVVHACSNAIVHFICSIYAPVCIINPDGSSITLKPCRELCTYVRSTCEPFMLANGFEWPQQFECNNFPSNTSRKLEDICVNPPNLTTIRIPVVPGVPTTAPPTTPNRTTTTPSTSTPSSSQPTTATNPINGTKPTVSCPSALDLNKEGHVLANSSYIFANIPNCAVLCEGIYFSHAESNVAAPVFIFICALICIGFTVFTVGTFLIDRQRYHYPERPVIFLALCYLILSLAYVVGAIVKLENPSSSYACSDTADDASFIFQRLPDATPTYHSASCVILFIFIYYFQMVGAIWWVVLTLTWFMASTLKWGEEAVERPWLLYHIFAWCLPAIQVIFVLALQLVDGDQLSGICFTGNHHYVGLGVFVLLPLSVFLIMGTVFLVIGFSSLVHIHLQVSKDPSKSRRLQRLIIRILVYSLLYIIPNVIYLCLCIYELAERGQWESSCSSSSDKSVECSSSPQFAALLMKYLMLFIVGIFSTFWVISWKTFLAWQKFFTSIFCCRRNPDYALPIKKHTETTI